MAQGCVLVSANTTETIENGVHFEVGERCTSSPNGGGTTKSAVSCVSGSSAANNPTRISAQFVPSSSSCPGQCSGNGHIRGLQKKENSFLRLRICLEGSPTCCLILIITISRQG